MRSSRKRGLRGYLLNKSLTEPIWHYLCSRLRAAGGGRIKRLASRQWGKAIGLVLVE